MRRLLSLTTVAALVCCLCGASVFGKNDSDPKEPAEKSTPVATKTDAARSEKLRTDVSRLLADARAGKLKMPAQQFPQPTNRNNLSTGAKIGIVAAIAGVIFVIIVVHQVNSD